MDKIIDWKIGDFVTYIPTGQIGRVKSFTELGTFVVFHCNKDWNNYNDYTSQLCRNVDLIRTEEVF